MNHLDFVSRGGVGKDYNVLGVADTHDLYVTDTTYNIIRENKLCVSIQTTIFRGNNVQLDIEQTQQLILFLSNAIKVAQDA